MFIKDLLHIIQSVHVNYHDYISMYCLYIKKDKNRMITYSSKDHYEKLILILNYPLTYLKKIELYYLSDNNILYDYFIKILSNYDIELLINYIDKYENNYIRFSDFICANNYYKYLSPHFTLIKYIKYNYLFIYLSNYSKIITLHFLSDCILNKDKNVGKYMMNRYKDYILTIFKQIVNNHLFVYKYIKYTNIDKSLICKYLNINTLNQIYNIDNMFIYNNFIMNEKLIDNIYTADLFAEIKNYLKKFYPKEKKVYDTIISTKKYYYKEFNYKESHSRNYELVNYFKKIVYPEKNIKYFFIKAAFIYQRDTTNL